MTLAQTRSLLGAILVTGVLLLSACGPDAPAAPPNTPSADQLAGVATTRGDASGAGSFAVAPLRALSTSNGGLLWKAKPGQVAKGVPVAFHNSLYVVGSSTHSTSKDLWSQLASARDDLYSVDASTGQTRWSFDGDGSGIASPAYADGIVAFTTGTNVLHAVDALTGKEVWHYTKQDTRFGAPTATSDAIYFQTGDAQAGTVTLLALELKTGKEKWSFQAPGSGYVDESKLASQTVNGGVVYFSTGWSSSTNGEQHNSTLYAVDANTGKQIWKYEAPNPTDGSSPFEISTPAIDSGFVYFDDSHSSIVALNVQTGEQVWSFDTNEINPALAVAGGTVYVTCYRAALALDAKTGKQKWKFDFESGSTTLPSVAGNVVYFGKDMTVYALDTASGKELWHYDVPDQGQNLSNITATDGAIYFIGSNQSNVYALHGP